MKNGGSLRPTEAAVLSQNCQICLETVSIDKIMLFDGQYHEICKDCFKAFLVEEIIQRKVNNMRCPHCSSVVSEQILNENIDRATMSKYRMFRRQDSVMRNADEQYCPNPRCSVILSKKKNTVREVLSCPHCGQLICVKCSSQAHSNKTCAQVI